MKEFIELPANKMSIVKRGFVFGKATNDAPYITRSKTYGACPYYTTWYNMLKRCYSPSTIKVTSVYEDATVCSEWLLFSNFRDWMKLQDWKEKTLDKDILIIGNKVYSPETCIFVTARLNSLLTHKRRKSSSYLVGVAYNKLEKRFQAECVTISGRHYLGKFKTEHEAHQAYVDFKVAHILEIASLETSIILKEALIRQAQFLETSCKESWRLV